MQGTIYHDHGIDYSKSPDDVIYQASRIDPNNVNYAYTMLHFQKDVVNTILSSCIYILKTYSNKIIYIVPHATTYSRYIIKLENINGGIFIDSAMVIHDVNLVSILTLPIVQFNTAHFIGKEPIFSQKGQLYYKRTAFIARATIMTNRPTRYDTGVKLVGYEQLHWIMTNLKDAFRNMRFSKWMVGLYPPYANVLAFAYYSVLYGERIQNDMLLSYKMKLMGICQDKHHDIKSIILDDMFHKRHNKELRTFLATLPEPIFTD